MDILERVRSDLRGASLARQKEVAEAIGIPWATLRKIIDSNTTNPRYSTVEKLRAYYMSQAERSVPLPVLQQSAQSPLRRQMG